MPVYFFDLLNAERLFRDDTGTELASLDDVQSEAAYALADLLRDELRTTGDPVVQNLMMLVRDSNGPVFQVKYSLEITHSQSHSNLGKSLGGQIE